MDSYKGGGEARRVINVVYFLSRGGRTDQPHLFRVNLSHLHRAGVRLRDVKRWLSEVRGKDMPGNFSWSYKRKYKSGYVWQDLLDDDLITPISDNEYVLKGCDVRRTPPPCSEAPKHFPIDEKKLNSKGSWERKQVEEVVQVQVTRDYDKSSPKPPPPIDQAFPVGAEGNNPAPFRIVLPQDLLQPKQRRQREAAVRSTTKSTDQQQQQALVLAARPAAAAMGGEKQQRPAVGSARRVRVAQVLHSILTCGAADGVDDAAHRPVVPRQRVDDDDGWQRTPFCPGMDGCGISMSRKVKLQRGGGGKDGKAKRDGGRRDRVAAAHKPATLPRCSQCGKGFKPQELHSHMQSCRGLRERMRSSARMSVDRSQSSTAKADHSSTDRPHTVFLLTES